MPVDTQVANAGTEPTVAAVAPAIAPAPEPVAKPPEQTPGQPLVTPEGYKSLQRQIAKLERDNRAMTGKLAQTLDKLNGDADETEFKAHQADAMAEDYNATLQTKREAVKAIIREHGFDPDNPIVATEFDKAFKPEGSWDVPETVARVRGKLHKEKVTKMAEDTKTTTELETLKAENARLKSDLVKAGLGGVDMTPGSGGSMTANDAYAAYANGSITAEEAKSRGAKFS